MRRIVVWTSIVCACAAGALQLNAKDETAATVAASAAPANESEIRQAVAAYVDAFNHHDSAALAKLWSREAVYVDRVTGVEAAGREAIARQFEAMFEHQPDVKLSISTESISFLSPNVAVEHGTSKLLVPKEDPDEINYAAVYVKRDGQWLLDRVNDDEEKAPPSHYEQLKVLQWMVGKWVDNEGDDVDAEGDCNWSKNRNFLVRSYALSIRGQINMSGMQVIGWDPAAKTVRSWTFDSDGTFAEATWTHKGDSWFVRNTGVVADGRRGSMVNVIKMVDKNTFTWQTIERTVGGELLPNIDEVVIVRK